jgi:hypothetical protein
LQLLKAVLTLKIKNGRKLLFTTLNTKNGYFGKTLKKLASGLSGSTNTHLILDIKKRLKNTWLP